MDAILQSLRDPGWWFSVLFVGIIAGVIAGFAKDGIGKALASVSASYKLRRDEKAKAREELIELLATNPQHLVLAYLQAMVGLLLFAIVLVLFTGAPVLLESSSTTAIFPIDRHFFARQLLAPALGVFAIVVGFRATSRFALASEALRRYRKKHSIPKWP